MADFTLPELGENVTAGDVLRVLVKPGDTVTKDQTVLELETDKATIEVPSSVAGRVTAVSVKAGDKVKVGQVVLTVEDGAGKPATAPAAAPQKAPGKAPEKASAPAEDDAVGASPSNRKRDEGPADEEDVEGPKRAAAPGGGVAPGGKGKTGETGQKELPADRPSTAGASASKVVDITRGARPSAEPAAADMPPAPAAPSVRRMARELGVDIDTVSGSGTDGRISIEDVKAHARRLLEGAARAGGGASGTPGSPGTGVALPDFSRWGEIERQPMRPVRRKTAEHLSAAWRAIPHVTQHDLADITALEELRKKYAKEAEDAGGNLTVTAIAVKVVAVALKVFPQFNASIDLAAEEIIYKKYVNIGIAVDTDRGLLVPVVRDADTKNIIQIAVEIAQLSAKARDRKISLGEMQGGCFSISNLGGIGGTYFTPIVNAPELAILGISRARMEPVWQATERGRGPASGEFVPRLMLPLSLSYDHRAIDGADGIRFLRWVVQAIEQPFLLALQG
jgi:pyruvate dehydrogenase E2 component (dihydrolipoamide acetyltransferase)